MYLLSEQLEDFHSLYIKILNASNYFCLQTTDLQTGSQAHDINRRYHCILCVDKLKQITSINTHYQCIVFLSGLNIIVN